MIFAVVSLTASVASAQEKDDEPPVDSREITSLDFQAKRKPLKGGIDGTTAAGAAAANRANNNGGKPPPPPATKPKQNYKFVKRIPRRKKKSAAALGGIENSKRPDSKKTTPKPEFKAEEVGVTFWRLRRKQKGEDDAPNFPVTINGVRENWTAERVNSETRFRPGDRVRFTVESSRAGFLYIVNREFYKDGTAGKPSLIYPTLRNRGGENRVEAGDLIDIPSGASFFNVTTESGAGYAGEELLIIISPTKINLPFELGLKARELSPETVEKWLEDWEASVDVYDGQQGEGVAYTKEEADATVTGDGQSRSLTQEEPVPQTLYRVWTTGKDQVLLIPVRMMAQKSPE